MGFVVIGMECRVREITHPTLVAETQAERRAAPEPRGGREAPAPCGGGSGAARS